MFGHVEQVTIPQPTVPSLDQQFHATMQHAWMGYDWTNTTEVGHIIESVGGSAIHFPITKALGYELTPTGLIPFEMLLYKEGVHKYIPYRLRFYNGTRFEEIVNYDSLAKIWSLFYPKDADPFHVSDPRWDLVQTYLDAPTGMPTGVGEACICLSQHPGLDKFAYNAYSVKEVGNSLSSISRWITGGSEHRSLEKNPLLLASSIVPFSMPRSLAQQFANFPEDPRSWIFADPIISTYVPPALDMERTGHNPDVVYDTCMFSEVASAISSSGGTEFHMVFLITNGIVPTSSVDIRKFVNRYATLGDNQYDSYVAAVELQHHAIPAAMSSAATYADKYGEDGLMDILRRPEFVIEIEKTFNEEARVTFLPNVDGSGGISFHLDLAYMSLCSMGVGVLYGPEPISPHDVVKL